MRKRKFNGREKYRCKVRARRTDKYGVYKDTYIKSNSIITLKIGDYILLDLNSKIYNKIFNEMKNDELKAYFATDEVIELLTELVDSDNIKNNIVIAIPETERQFREIVFDKIYTLIQAEKELDKLSQKEVNNSFDLNFTIPNQFQHLDLTKKLH